VIVELTPRSTPDLGSRRRTSCAEALKRQRPAIPKSKPYQAFQASMTARTGRAVEAVPGATLDRRRGVLICDSFPKRLSAGEIARGEGGSRAWLTSKSGNGINLVTRVNGSLDLDGADRSEAPLPRLIGLGSQRAGRPAVAGPRIPIDDPTFLLLHGLELHRGAFEILLLLYREEAASKSRMRRCLRPSQRAIDGSIHFLSTERLIEGAGESSFPFSVRFHLTDRGKSLIETPISRWSIISWG